MGLEKVTLVKCIMILGIHFRFQGDICQFGRASAFVVTQ